MNYLEILQIIFGIIVILSALSIWYQKEVVKSAFSFLATMLGVAALFVLEGADFVAATHLAIYVGGVVVLLLFGIMFVHKISDEKIISDKQYKLSGISLSILFILLISSWIFKSNLIEFIPNKAISSNADGSTLDEIARLFLTDYILFFELGGILLTIALLGVAVLVGKER
ncbi:NADH:ubiquinone oxidoreductase subunit 6 (chain J) [Bernardetia litoralis DSM 6794]|uniref:NADH-quinone oxidoreductase subunit J n=1 Tax=Bernardetia litoralis (strain ATCC 23117 / DSM 6794 / NBRC 15988 / NCIMB 1366 / Fx l1 / Sio-4) TaxID=880071 RepID=I4AQJ1_BERLS|nr:NADH-quinone oxidoreductase subunit J [Bernardetia litoralis]AFM06226.1 NADH:ubiquinone oxidoreductase subunit 6 (chain J) [Bernardetia litoralis DSM 6794]